jgi:hypothetical protein
MTPNADSDSLIPSPYRSGGEGAFVFAIVGRPAKRYHSPSEVAWDRQLDPEMQVRALEKWLKMETARYVQDRETASLLRMRDIKGTLSLLRRIRGD